MATPHIWQSKPDEITEFIGEEIADIVIIGGGISGVVAAQSAAAAGADVIVIEKFSKTCGHGTDICAINSIVHKRAGIYIDPAEAARLVYAWSQQQANYHLIRMFTERSGEILSDYIELMESKGFEVSLNTTDTARADWSDLDEKYRMFRTAHNFTVPEGSTIKGHAWGVLDLVRTLEQDAREHGARFFFNTKAEQLIKEGDRVTGVVVSDAALDGESGYRKIVARTAVIMATGGITENDEMKECFCPISLRVDKNVYVPQGGNLGEGHVMAKWAGGALSRCYPAPIIHPINLVPLRPGLDSSWLTVDCNGKRFMNEMTYEPLLTHARLNAPGNVAWAVWDSDYLEHYRHSEPSKFNSLADDIEEQVEAAVENGTFVKADTLEELAEKMGVPAGNLVATVARYNELVEAGEDVDFGVPQRFLNPCVKGPFYADKLKAMLLALPYGMHVNDNSQICTEDDEPIPGLYAVGNMQGDFFAISYPVTLPGCSNGRSICFGHLVGTALANGLNIDGTPVL